VSSSSALLPEDVVFHVFSSVGVKLTLHGGISGLRSLGVRLDSHRVRLDSLGVKLDNVRLTLHSFTLPFHRVSLALHSFKSRLHSIVIGLHSFTSTLHNVAIRLHNVTIRLHSFGLKLEGFRATPSSFWFILTNNTLKAPILKEILTNYLYTAKYSVEGIVYRRKVPCCSRVNISVKGFYCQTFNTLII
jgi:hypothetical protein